MSKRGEFLKKSILYTVFMLLVWTILGLINGVYMMSYNYSAPFPTFIISILFLTISVIYFLKVNLKVALPIVVLWILITLCGIMNLIYYFFDNYSTINLLLDFISQPLIGISFLTDLLDNFALFGTLYIFISCLILLIPLIRLRKQTKSNDNFS